MPATTAPPASDAIIDQLMDFYLAWKEACVEAQAAYRRWTRAANGDRALAHAAFTAALDREDCAARGYGSAAERASALWGEFTPRAA